MLHKNIPVRTVLPDNSDGLLNDHCITQMFAYCATPLGTIYKHTCFSTCTVSNEVPVVFSTINVRPTL